MAIKKMDVDMFEKITEGKQSDKEDMHLSEQDAELLFEKAINELKKITVMFNMMSTAIADTSMGFALLETEEFKEFKDSTEYYINFVLPSLLKGDIDSIIENAFEKTEEENEIFKKDLEKLRTMIYQELSEKYL